MQSSLDKRPHRMRLQPVRGWAALELGELIKYRDLFWLLMLRDVKLRYKQTALGVLWVILQPVLASLIFAVIFGQFAGLPSENEPYLLLVYSGMLPWNLFAGGVQRAGNSLIGDARLISKVYFPRMLIPMASASAVLVDTCVAFLVSLLLLIAYQIPLSWTLLSVPLLIVLAWFISIGVSLFFSALNVYYRDFSYALPFIMQVWMYASPVVYSITVIPENLRPIYALNPLVGVIEMFRWAFLGTGEFPVLGLIFSLLGGILIFIVSAFIFQRVERNFADVV